MITGCRVYKRFEKCCATSTGVVECDNGKRQFAKFVKFAIDKGFVSAES